MPKIRVLLFFPEMYTLSGSFKQGFKSNDCEVLQYDYEAYVSPALGKMHSHIGKAPYKIRSAWYKYYVVKINQLQLEEVQIYKPDLVLVYNSGMLLPETVSQMKKKSKVCFFLGDSPFYTPTNDFFLPSLMQADGIFCSDSYWVKQLKGLGLRQVHFLLIGANPQINFIRDVTKPERDRWSSDLVFIGVPYLTSRGFKRALFLEQFCDLDIRIYTGKGFGRWYAQFPKLEQRIVHPGHRLTHEEVNTILNCCKIYPVDANPGLINGVHLRVTDCIASGILPLAEYRKDLKQLFGASGLPIIHDYTQAGDMARYFLDHEEERTSILDTLKAEMLANYSPKITTAKLMELAFQPWK